MIICVLKQILHKKKSIFMQLLESPIPPLTAAALRMIICKRPVPPDHHLQEAGPSFWQPQKGHEKCIFETLHNEIKCVLSIKGSNFMEKMGHQPDCNLSVFSRLPLFYLPKGAWGFGSAALVTKENMITPWSEWPMSCVALPEYHLH